MKRVQVLLHQIDDNEDNNIRVDYGDIEELKARIKSFGIMGVIRVRETEGSDGATEYVLDDGFRRVRACKSLVADGVTHSDTGDSLEVMEAELLDSGLSATERSKMSLAINTSQKAWTPYEQGLEISNLMKAGVPVEEIQEQLGLKDMAVKQRLHLLEAPKELQAALRSGDIGFAHARAIQRIPDEGLQIELTKELLNDKDLASRVIEARAVQLTDKAINELGAQPKRKRKSLPDPTQKIVLRPTQDVITQLDTYQSDLSEVEDKMVRSETEGYIKALQWVLVDKASLTEELREAAAAKKAAKEAKVEERRARKVERDSKKAERESAKAKKVEERDAKKAERASAKAKKVEERKARKVERDAKRASKPNGKATTSPKPSENTDGKSSDDTVEA